RVASGLPLPAEFAPFPAPDVAEPDAASCSASSEPVSRSSGGHTPRETSQALPAAAVAAPSSSPPTPAATLAPAATDALLEPPWPSFRTPQAEPAEFVVDPVDIDFKPALRLPSWWMLVPVAVAAIAFWAVVLADRTPESQPVALSLGSILVESGFEEQRVREVAESHLDDVRECHARLQTRLEAPVHIPLHLVVQPSGIVGSAGMKYGVAE